MDLNKILEELDKLYAEANLDKAELRLGATLPTHILFETS